MFRSDFFKIMAVVFASISMVYPQAWECELCPPRNVGIYDLDVQVPQPSWEDSILTFGEWLFMFNAGGGVAEKLMTDDPSKTCYYFTDGQFVDAFDSTGVLDTLTYEGGVTWVNLPPAGEIEAVDYILYGFITGSQGNYSLQVKVEAAGTREMVASSSIPYDLSLSGGENGKRAAEPLIPLMGKIREFERQKRNTMNTVAIYADNEPIELIPEKYQIDVNESIDITIRLKDCDDEPLRDRSIKLDLKGGTVSSNFIVTDEDGEAVTTLTAGSNPGWGIIQAEYRYDVPFRYAKTEEEKFIAFGEANVSINEPIDDVWQVQANISTRLLVNADTTWTLVVPGYKFKYENLLFEQVQGSASLHLLVRNEASGSGNDFVYSMSEPPIVMSVSGNKGGNSYEKKKEYMSGEIPIVGEYLSNRLAAGSRIRNDWFKLSPSNGGFYFEYSENYKYVDISAGGEANCGYKTKTYDGESWITDTDNYNRDEGLGVAWSQEESGGSINYGNSVYSATFSKTERSFRFNDEFGTIVETFTQSLNATIRPFSKIPTAIKNPDKSPELKGGKHTLHLKNYPNPFNPSTTIEFNLPKSSNVTLKIYNIIGEEVATLVSDRLTADSYTYDWNASDLASGVYLYRLFVESLTTKSGHFVAGEAGDFVETRKMVLMR
jgi:hypothetical protein